MTQRRSSMGPTGWNDPSGRVPEDRPHYHREVHDRIHREYRVYWREFFRIKESDGEQAAWAWHRYRKVHGLCPEKPNASPPQYRTTVGPVRSTAPRDPGPERSPNPAGASSPIRPTQPGPSGDLRGQVSRHEGQRLPAPPPTQPTGPIQGASGPLPF